MWNFKWTFSKNIVSVTMIGIVTILPAMSVQADGLNPEQFLELKQAKELAYQGKDLDFLANEIMQLDSKYAEKRSIKRNNLQEYYSDEDLATLEAINNVRAVLIRAGGIAVGAKRDNEVETAKPVQVDTRNSRNWSYYGWDARGDIFIQTYTTFGAGIGDMGHAALGLEQFNTTLEAPGPGQKVQWIRGKWFREKGTLLTSVNDNGAWAWYRVKGASLAQYKATENYAKTYINGSPYPHPIAIKFYFPDMSAKEYHCGEVVHFVWLRGAGIRVSNSLDNRAIGPYGMGPQHKYNQVYLYRGDLSSKGSHK